MTEQELLQTYARPIVHMRRQFEQGRLAPILGAGISKSFGLPAWPDFVKAIAEDPAVSGQEILKRVNDRGSLPFMTELLFQHFRKTELDKRKDEEVRSLEFENRTHAKWQRICAEHLYQGATEDFEKRLDDHPYLTRILPIIRRAALTVTYNFDDFVELALRAKKLETDKTRGFETVTNPWIQFRRTNGVVYHANGVIKSELMELPVDKFILSESSFARDRQGDGSFLLNHFCKNTCLLIGSSLEDESLRSTLIRAAATSPGNFHYCIYYLRKGETVEPADAEAIRRAHFNVFNLITLFLGDEDIAALAALIDHEQVSTNVLSDRAQLAGVPLAYRYYITGAVGVGKSTTARHLQNLVVLDEWIDPRPPILAKPWDTLTPEETEIANAFIVKQFAIKNDTLRREPVGLFIVDRPPLDPLTFTPREDWRAKATLLLETICPDRIWRIVNGTVILLRGDPIELSVRVLATGRDDYSQEKLTEMQAALEIVYRGAGVFRVETRGMSMPEVTRKVAEIVFFETYNEADLHRSLEGYADEH